MKTFILSTALGIAALFGLTTVASAADSGEKILPSASAVQTDTQATTQVRYGYGWGNRGYYNRGYYRPYYRSYYRPYYYNNYYGGYGYGNGVYIGGGRGGVRIGW